MSQHDDPWFWRAAVGILGVVAVKALGVVAYLASQGIEAPGELYVVIGSAVAALGALLK